MIWEFYQAKGEYRSQGHRCKFRLFPISDKYALIAYNKEGALENVVSLTSLEEGKNMASALNQEHLSSSRLD